MTTELASEPTATSRSDRRGAQRLATREKLLEISIAEFQRTGFGQTDIATIVERAGVSRGTFYFHFATKDDVLAELRMREERRIVQEVSPQLARGEALEGVLRAVVAGILHAEDRLGAELVREICAVQFRPSVVDSDSASDHPVAELVMNAVARASQPTSRATGSQDSDDLSVIFLVGVFGLLSVRHGPSDDRDRLIDGLISLTVKGVSRP